MEKYFYIIMAAVRQNLGLEADDTSMDERINAMTRQEVLNRVCEWEGLIDYGETILDWIEDIWGVDLDDIAERHDELYRSGK